MLRGWTVGTSFKVKDDSSKIMLKKDIGIYRYINKYQFSNQLTKWNFQIDVDLSGLKLTEGIYHYSISSSTGCSKLYPFHVKSSFFIE